MGLHRSRIPVMILTVMSVTLVTVAMTATAVTSIQTYPTYERLIDQPNRTDATMRLMLTAYDAVNPLTANGAFRRHN